MASRKASKIRYWDDKKGERRELYRFERGVNPTRPEVFDRSYEAEKVLERDLASALVYWHDD